ncbi:MAG: DUF2490 domain-containing protein [Lentimonas sp.]
MTRYFSLVLLLCALVAPSVRAASDSGASYNLLLKYSLSDEWFLISRSNMASRFHYDDNFFGYTGLGLGYNLNEHWSFRAGYRHAWIRPGDEWLEENRPYAEAYYATKLDGFRVTSRSRFEFRFFDHRDDDVRFRNEIVVEAPWEFSPLKLKPYVEEEFFYGFDQSQIEANWLGGGLSWRPMKGVKLKLGYRWVRQRIGTSWRNRNVIVTGVNVFF